QTNGCLLMIFCFHGAFCIAKTGRPTSFSCSHKLAKSRTKYFCRDPCQAEEDILARVKPGERTAKGRLSLKDFGNGVFNVTFNPLQQSDTHLYYCSVDRVGFDTFTSVNIRVQKAVTTLPAHVTSALPSQHVTNSTLLLMDSSKQPASSSIGRTNINPCLFSHESMFMKK
uniref:Immunoglobulin V-set domain-containing protein n=1 Tax=Oryzias melastigma TaxID=30732 RepID=A0A3B3DQ10_ORYME